MTDDRLTVTRMNRRVNALIVVGLVVVVRAACVVGMLGVDFWIFVGVELVVFGDGCVGSNVVDVCVVAVVVAVLAVSVVVIAVVVVGGSVGGTTYTATGSENPPTAPETSALTINVRLQDRHATHTCAEVEEVVSVMFFCVVWLEPKTTYFKV